jgi:hypothetical protein
VIAVEAASADIIRMPTNPREWVQVLPKGEPEMYSLSFERREGGWDIFLPAGYKPIGEVFRSSDEWIGRMTLDGYRALTSSKNPQNIVDEFEAWVAAGTPADSPLLQLNVKAILLLEETDRHWLA